LRYPDIEDELNEYDKRRMHIILGRTKDGRPMILRGQGALSDFFEWGGLNEFPRIAKLFSEGKINLPYAVKELAKAPINKFFGGISPVIKAPVEYIMGATLFPDITEPRQIKDKTRQLLRNLQLEDIYDWVKGNPQRPLEELILKFTPLVITDSEQNAYNDIQNLKRLFLEKKGKGQFSNNYFTPRSQAMYNYRLALKYRDKKAIEKWKDIIKELKINKYDAVKSLNPLSGLSYPEQAEFVKKFMTGEDRRKFERAMKFYRNTIAQE